VLPEEQATADATLVRAAKRMTQQQFYNQRHTSTGQFLAERAVRMTKHEMVENPLELSKEDFMSVSNLSMTFYVAAKLQLHYPFFK